VLVPLVGGTVPPSSTHPDPSASATPGTDPPASLGPAPEPSGPPSPEPGVGRPLDPALVAEAVSPFLRGGALGEGRSRAHIVDVASGESLYSAAADDPVTPASTMKLVTAASVLTSLGPDAVLRTRTVILDPSAATPRVVVVGAGDPSLASTPGKVGGPGTSIKPASLAGLASATARSLATRGIDEVRVGFDDALFTGPAVHPTWARAFPAWGIVAPVSALQVDQGRRSPTSVVRVANPAEAAARQFAALLEDEGITVVGRLTRVSERPDSVALATVASPPVARLVERMLGTSDNDYAEALARLGATAAGLPASFAGVGRRGGQVLAELGIGDPGDVVVDGSGLSRANALTARTLTGLLRLTDPALGPIGPGMPVGGVTGSLRSRFDTEATEPARGVARAKTGTLTGVVGLAGYLSRPDGRLLAFAILDESVPGGALGGRRAIDRALGELVECDCAQR
jgi:D-alanyl-D-alanine carboxypeptidase/D-alanyl-D-alanine-endopeptidase (penicillin-binding protein 4)